ncbi:MAG: hypothetical protein AAF268_02975 [Cyanobacteria bacterium P01_A01_bin.3]
MTSSPATTLEYCLEQSAQQLLSNTGALQALSQIGEVRIHGALQLRTMVWPEIDLYLGTTGTPTMGDATAVIEKLRNCVAIRDVHIINQTSFPRRFAFPETILVDVVLVWETVEWKLDIAILPIKRFSEATAYNTKLLAVMTESHRQAIVNIKRQAIRSPRYRRMNWTYVREGSYFFSADVYSAVINSQAKSYDEFCKILKSTRNITL